MEGRSAQDPEPARPVERGHGESGEVAVEASLGTTMEVLPLEESLAREIARLTEKIEQQETLADLRRRLDQLHRATAPSPNRGPMLTGIVAVLATIVLPFSTFVHGVMTEQRERVTAIYELERETLIAEHTVVDGHLQNALTRDMLDTTHLRHLRFLRGFRPQHPTWPPVAWPAERMSLLTALGEWADAEYTQHFVALDLEAKQVSESINTMRVEIELAQGKLEVDRGWVRGVRNTWAVDGLTDEDFGPGLDLIQQILSNREAELGEESSRLSEAETRWREIESAYNMDKDKKPPSVVREPQDQLKKMCEANKSECVKLGDLYYYRALNAHDFEKQREWFVLAYETYDSACAARVPSGCALLARSLRLEQGIPDSIEWPIKASAIKLTEACDMGDPQGCNGLGWCMMDDEKEDGIEMDVEAALALFQKSCHTGDLNACDSLGTWYAGKKDKQDKEKARVVFEDACIRNEIRACLNLINLDLKRPTDDFNRPTAH